MGLFSWLGDLFGGDKNKNNKYWNQQLQNNFNQNNERQTQFASDVGTITTQERARQEEMYRALRDQYMGILNGTGDAASPWEEIYNTGGLDPNEVARIHGISDKALSWADNPISAADKKTLFANGTYDEFNRTGGLSDADRANFRARSNSTIPSFYDSLSSELDSRNRAIGSMNPGFSAGMAKLTRQRGQEAAANARNTEVDLTNLINQGRQWGASGLTNAEQALQSIIANAKSQGYNISGNLTRALLDAGQQGKLAGAAGLTGDRNTALSGLNNLYGQTPSWYSLLGMQGNAIGNIGQSALNYANTGIGANPYTSWTQGLGQLAGAAAPIFGAFGGTQKPPTSGGTGGGGGNWWAQLAAGL